MPQWKSAHRRLASTKLTSSKAHFKGIGFGLVRAHCGARRFTADTKKPRQNELSGLIFRHKKSRSYAASKGALKWISGTFFRFVANQSGLTTQLTYIKLYKRSRSVYICAAVMAIVTMMHCITFGGEVDFHFQRFFLPHLNPHFITASKSIISGARLINFSCTMQIMTFSNSI